MDHENHTAEFANLCGLVEHMLVSAGMGVWLDRLTLPASRYGAAERRKVIKKLLRTPARDTPVLLALITRNYVGLSGSGKKNQRYTLLEWEQASRVVRRNREPCDNERFLSQPGERLTVELARDAPVADVIAEVKGICSSQLASSRR